MKRLVFYLFLIIISLKSFSQEVLDTTAIDPVAVQKVEKHSPSKASILSAVLPGAGQFYNKKYWKIPILYAGFAAIIYSVDFNQNRYIIYKNALQTRTDGDETTLDEFEDVYSEENLRALKDFYRRNLDLSYIIGGIVYVLNILDAHVDAHLYYFDVSDDLSMKVSPVMIENKLTGFQNPGLGIKLNFN